MVEFLALLLAPCVVLLPLTASAIIFDRSGPSIAVCLMCQQDDVVFSMLAVWWGPVRTIHLERGYLLKGRNENLYCQESTAARQSNPTKSRIMTYIPSIK